jgi:N,N'-diacetyllegionaminate synthase
MSPKFSSDRTYVIAEIAQAHEGSLALAHSFIDAVADTGADAIKFQTHLAERESSNQESFRVSFPGKQDKTRFDYWKRMEFELSQWKELADHAREKKLDFLSSPFSEMAVDWLSELGVPAWKIGSGEFRSQRMLDRIIETGKPILFSTGMSYIEEVDQAVARFRKSSSPFVVLQCTSKYPTKLEEVGMNVLDLYRSRYSCPVGLSDHSGTVHPGLAAIARGCEVLEVHVTFDKRMFGPDAAASVTVDQLKHLCEFRNAVSTFATHPVDKDAMAEKLSPMRKLFTRSLAPARDLPEGTVLTAELLCEKKPGTGIPAAEISKVVGKKLKRDVSQADLLSWENLE